MRSFCIVFVTCVLFVDPLLVTCVPFVDPLRPRAPFTGSITPGFAGSQTSYLNSDVFFLESNNSAFRLGFVNTQASATLFTLSIVHKSSMWLIWSANRASPVSKFDKLKFEDNGNVVLRRGEDGTEVWRLDNTGKNASRIELRDSGNLVVVSGDGTLIWESFDHPTDTLITNQIFREGMKLISSPSLSNMTYALEIESEHMFLSVNSLTPQVYWSMRTYTEIRYGFVLTSSSLIGDSWHFFDQKHVLLQKFRISDNTHDNATWIAVLGSNGVISFTDLGSGASTNESSIKIPSDQCATPESCGPYYVCSGSEVCSCVSGLSRVQSDCKTGIASPCKKTNNNSTLPLQLVDAGEDIDYFALEFTPPFSEETDLYSCQEFCNNNCSCLGLFFQNSTGNCFLFDWIGSYKNNRFRDESSRVVSYIKVARLETNGTRDEGNKKNDEKHSPYVLIIIMVPIFIIGGLILVAFGIHRRKKKILLYQDQSSEEEDFLDNLAGMPSRFSFKELQSATDNFSVKLGQGGFGSVYEGILPDGSRIAVKKLEGIGQGKKEFRAEVSTIGSIHHQHLARLRGFCVERTHRLLAYEFLSKGSLERWIFKRREGDIFLDWDTRFNIALGTAKGLAYLHEECDARIIHCDIKPENILLDDNFNAKVSDFGLAKLMTREQSNVFTTLRGTRGYLAPEWITNHAISEKIDVYSYGMVLLELIGGRKNFDQSESSEKFHFPSYAFKMMEEGKLMEIVDGKMKNVDVNDERLQRAMKTALWCIQKDMHLRPSMSKVVQMLEGVFPVFQPPSSSIDSMSSESSNYTSENCPSAVGLSGPR